MTAWIYPGEQLAHPSSAGSIFLNNPKLLKYRIQRFASGYYNSTGNVQGNFYSKLEILAKYDGLNFPPTLTELNSLTYDIDAAGCTPTNKITLLSNLKLITLTPTSGILFLAGQTLDVALDATLTGTASSSITIPPTAAIDVTNGSTLKARDGLTYGFIPTNLNIDKTSNLVLYGIDFKAVVDNAPYYVFEWLNTTYPAPKECIDFTFDKTSGTVTWNYPALTTHYTSVDVSGVCDFVWLGTP